MSRPTGPLRVLHFAAGNLFGGVETLLRTLAECPDESPGLSSEFAVCFEDRLSDELRATGAQVHRLGAVKFSRPWTVWQARRRLARVIRDRGIDVLINHGSWPHMLGAPVARRANRSLVYWMHDRIGDDHWSNRGAARTPPDFVLVNSQGTAETLPRIFPGARSEVLYIPVRPQAVDRTEARGSVRTELGTPAADVVVVTACRLERWKGHALLIEALSLLKDRPGWTAWVVGGAQRPHEQVYADELRAAAESGGIGGRVRFLGQRRDVPRLLAAADIHCQPNTSPEPFGIAYVEALYAGLPVVSTRMGGAAEIVDETCGVLVPPGDPSALASALSGLIDDPAARSKLGSGGPRRASELCAPGTVLPRLQAILKGLHAATPPAPRATLPTRPKL